MTATRGFMNHTYHINITEFVHLRSDWFNTSQSVYMGLTERFVTLYHTWRLNPPSPPVVIKAAPVEVVWPFSVVFLSQVGSEVEAQVDAVATRLFIP
ncbi:uncharacterized protein MELLADRAFT_54882 [Melampsora larici-populina 98AG31]|uniref:Uncharacterized protein n=1 Tax=Melampsora larici-populina (strain 98AG31 / pathotype 3-4-7) TaxID=747676 RepID=F4R8A5_MELLP|nr:uncharacterized protein MELLADRAFT_54882 [Melampsora larici-populina 98AG31]EGG11645.1 hypothetical protein MELLADRAFT_54882 [Melampsora larici-populina 98AG31]